MTARRPPKVRETWSTESSWLRGCGGAVMFSRRYSALPQPPCDCCTTPETGGVARQVRSAAAAVAICPATARAC